MSTLTTFKHLANAMFLKTELEKAGIDASVEETRSDQTIAFKVVVNLEHLEAGKSILSDLNLDDTVVDPDSDGYLEKHSEWMDRMYDPGHYTGGKVPHFLTDKSNWKIYAAIYLIGGFLSVYLIIRTDTTLDYELLMWVGLMIIVGVSLLWQLRKK